MTNATASNDASSWVAAVPYASRLLALTLPACLYGCAAIGLGLLISPPIPVDYYEFDPQAEWGQRARLGGCPVGVPAILVNLKDPDWVSVRFGVWDAKHAGTFDFGDPIAFISITKSWTFLIHKQEARVKTPITVRAATSSIVVSLPDGTQRSFDVPELAQESTIVGGFYNNSPGWGKTIKIPLAGIPGQDMTIEFPDLVVNEEKVQAGRVAFSYKKTTRYGGC